MYTFPPPDEAMGDLFRSAEAELREVAERHGFSLRLTDARSTWFFMPEVEADWKPPATETTR